MFSGSWEFQLLTSDLTGVNRKQILHKLRTDPVYHIEKVQGVYTAEEYQKRVIRSVAQHERTVVAACHDVGKTWLAAKVILWFTSTFTNSKVITTAPTFNQVKRLLWSEIRAGFSKSANPLGGDMLTTEWKLSEEWFAVGFTSRAEHVEGEGQGGASTFQGFHAPYLLVVFDEATGIPLTIWKQMEGLMTSYHVRFLGIGNPTTKSCEFFKCFSNPAYKKITLNCFDSPNFPANGLHNMEDLTREYNRLRELTQDEQYEEMQKYVTVNKNLLAVKWVMQLCLKWGLTHPMVVSKCFGQFPEEDEYTLMPMGLVQGAQYRTYEPSPLDRVSIGVDVARFGSDKTIITGFKGNILQAQQRERKVLVKRDINEVVGALVRMIKDEPSHDIHIAVDATGLGSGVVDSLIEKRSEKIIPQYVEIREVHVGAGPGGRKGTKKEKEFKEQYFNLKARMFVELSQDLKSTLCLLEDDVYLEELPTIKYKFDSKGRWVIESKEDYRKRTGRSSPDDADSLSLANYARYDEAGIGNFNEDLNPPGKSTIIEHKPQEAQW
ncbi:MAG: hypothetical protein V4507_15225 [Verrucomicrobiota bacterium]